MKKTNFELEGLRYFGGNAALALLLIDDRRCAFTIEGVDALLQKHLSQQEQEQLKKIKVKMLTPGEYKDIQDDDFSGQQAMF